MALRAGYKGFKKLAPGLKLRRPGTIAIDNVELNKTFPTWEDQAVLGASWNELDVTASGKTENGVTFTINADKSITFVTEAGGATADTSIVFNSDFQITDENTHYYSGVTNGGADKYYLECYYRDNSNTYKGNTRVYDGVIPIAVSDKEGATKINTFILMVKSGFISTTPITVYPMVSPKADALYAPYAMTNSELTDVVQGIVVKKFTSAELTISAGQYSAQELNIANGNLIPLGVVGYTIAGAGNTDCSMWKNWMDLSSKKVLYGVKNNGAETQATVTVDIFVLYKG